MDIQHKKTGTLSKFYIEENGEQVAEIIVDDSGQNTITIQHTEVDEKLKGRNIGYELVKRVVEHAREHHLKIIPMCSFAKAVFDKKPEFKDVLT